MEHPRFRTDRVGRLWFLGAAILAAFIGCLLLNGCATNLATGKRQFNLISEAREVAIGQQADAEISAQMGLYPDSALQTYVSNLGLQMAAQSERPNLPWSFKVVDDPMVNAFALPGGFIYVTRGILAHLNSEAELTGVIGHEIGHVTGKHSVEQMSKQQVASIGLGVGTILEPRLEKFAGLASQGLGLLFLKYGRDDETEADYLGLRYMQRTQHDPRQLVGVMEMLDGVTQASGGSGIPEWLSTHPNPGNRATVIRSHVDTISTDLSKSVVGRDALLARIDGIVFGDNPRHGYFRENVFLHPDFKFRFEFPTGWTTANQVQGVIGINAEKDAMIQITLSNATSQTAAANQFFAQEGLAVSGTQTGNLNGIPAAWGQFSAQTADGALRGVAYFYSYEGNVFQVLGYGVAENWQKNDQTVTASVRSFAKLTDAKVLAVQPWRIRIVTLTEPMTIVDFNKKFPSPVPLATLMLINRCDENTRFVKGNKIKNVVGEILP